jgi:hypothetical protein
MRNYLVICPTRWDKYRHFSNYLVFGVTITFRIASLCFPSFWLPCHADSGAPKDRVIQCICFVLAPLCSVKRATTWRCCRNTRSLLLSAQSHFFRGMSCKVMEMASIIPLTSSQKFTVGPVGHEVPELRRTWFISV